MASGWDNVFSQMAAKSNDINAVATSSSREAEPGVPEYNPNEFQVPRQQTPPDPLFHSQQPSGHVVSPMFQPQPRVEPGDKLMPVVVGGGILAALVMAYFASRNN